ncbi:MAG: hypothetical protein CML68_06295 [Rhodobacteraceae bacterium]|nr:hypothetical protein [Paracoccaceae bacterium]MBB94193.1 hypothetical protein [Paracoccaceae bacterium]
MTGHVDTARALRLDDGRRLRLVHGPIDVIVTAEGPPPAREAAFGRATEAAGPILAELAAELPRLRRATGPAPHGPVARRMARAVARFAPAFLTPMAAVAGSVADHLCAAILGTDQDDNQDHGLHRLIVNNGGDIALWQVMGQVTAAICDDPLTGRAGGRITIPHDAGIGGLATSGWRGRSHSLGIADAVTVLARDAASADAAATLLANAVDLPGHPAVSRRPARDLAPDSDLGARPVTTGVGPLSPADCARAIDSGRALAQDFRARGLIRAAYLSLQDTRAIVAEKDLPDA